jgi:hypothetical protein
LLRRYISPTSLIKGYTLNPFMPAPFILFTNDPHKRT